ncbi:DsbA family protein [Halobaculum sp. MBLA0147]|uniref:DsbA family protein n=1 Tax=Halobaculum sp. MBLA0147 TaxID=3079934 RepID=UPI003524BFFB
MERATSQPNRLSRRQVLATTGTVVGGLSASAGCLGQGGSSYDCESAPESSVSSAPTPALGPSQTDANVVIQVWEDFSCPHCATFSLEVLPRIIDEYLPLGTIRYEHHDFPIPVRDWAWKAASAGRSVATTGGGKAFFLYADKVYQNQESFSLDTVGAGAEQADTEPCEAIQAAKGDVYRPVVRRDKEAGQQAGVDGTPAIFVNGSRVTGRSFDAVSSAIDRFR